MYTKYTTGLIMATVACLIGSSLHRGYTMTELNPFEFQIRNYLKRFSYDMEHVSNNTTVAVVNEQTVTELWSAYSGIIYVGKIVGCLTVSIMADHFGRKNTILVLTGLCGIVSLLQNVAIYINIYLLLLIGRLFDGYASSISSVLTSVYLFEIAPEHLRWGFATADPLFMTAGSIVTAILALPSLLGTSSLWPFVFIVGSALLLPILFLICQPDGPKFLIQKNKSEDAIISSIHHYQGTNVDVYAVWEDYKKLITPVAHRPAFRQLGLCCQKKWRKHVLITVALGCGLGFSGISVIVGYFTSIIANAGVTALDAKKCYLGVTVFRTLLSVVIALNVDKINSRRNALLSTLWATLAVFVGMLLIDVIDVYALKPVSADVRQAIVAVRIILIFVWSGLVCLVNPLCVLTNLECYPQHQRATAGAVFLLTAYVSAWGITTVYPTIQSMLGASSVVLFIPILLIATAYLQKKLPETNQQDIGTISSIISFGRSNQSRLDEIIPLLDDETSISQIQP